MDWKEFFGLWLICEAIIIGWEQITINRVHVREKIISILFTSLLFTMVLFGLYLV